MNSKNRILITGVMGRMGRELHCLLSNEKKLAYGGGIDSKTDKMIKLLFNDFSQVKGDQIDLVVDFSSPDFFDKTIAWCIAKRRPLVSGTTGLSQKQMKLISGAAENIPILWSSNMSIGVAVMNEMLQKFSSLQGYDFQIEEIHHNEKKDSPSGTAKTLQANLEKTLKKKLSPPISIRGGGVFGIHNIYSLGPEETILLQHTALNRTVFARGALRAAEFLLKQRKGLYTMADVIKQI